MRKLYLFFTALFIIFLSCNYGKTNGGSFNDELSYDYTYITNVTRSERPLSGINMGNALESPSYEGEWGVVIQDEYFNTIKKAGFKYLRIPIRWSAHANNDAPYTINTDFMNRVDHVVNTSLAEGLITIINIHHYNELFNNPAAHKDRFLGLWTQIANHFKDFSLNLYFEILNEPNANLTPSLWNIYHEEARMLIRATGGNNTTRKIIIGTAEWGGINGLSSLVIPNNATDPNIIVTVHYYNPFQFTHQGAEWTDGSSAWLGTTWTGTNAEKQAVINDFNTIKNFSNSHDNVPIFIGEFGAYSKADTASRKAWTDFVARQAEARGFFWAYWEFCSGFGAYNSSNDSWRKELLDALIPE